MPSRSLPHHAVLPCILVFTSATLTACGGGGGGGGSIDPVPPPTGADLSGAWGVTESLTGSGEFQSLAGQAVLEILTSGGSSRADWRSTGTLVRNAAREAVISSATLTITNNGSTAEFAVTMDSHAIRCTYTANLSGQPITSMSGTVDCPQSAMQGTWSATRGLPVADPLPAMAAITAMDMSTCAVAVDGRAYCWGKNTLGELGSGDTLPKPMPVAAAGSIPFTKIDLSPGGSHTCGIDTSGQAYCWGNHEGGRMGNGMSGALWTYSTTPIAVLGGHTFIDIAAGGDHVCAVATDGGVYCWGHNSAGQLGTGDFAERTMPTRIAGNTLFRAITAHQLISCGIAVDGSAWCWGDGSNGGLGNGTTNVSNVPVAVSGQLSFRSIKLGLWSTCGVTTTNAGYCWGSNSSGELGAGFASQLEPVPVPVTGGHSWRNISPGLLYSCGVVSDGTGYCWGGNFFGERGDGPFPAADRPAPGPVSGGLLFEQIDADWHTCGVTVDGKVYCWGPGDFGSIGDGSLKSFGVPTRVAGS